MPKFTSMPYCVGSAIPSDKMFDISPVTPLASNPEDAATIVAEVSAAAAAQASKSSAGCMNPNYQAIRWVFS